MTGAAPVAPFEGLKAIDFSQDVAGPYATRLLAGYGADVVKVEPPGTGDRSRGCLPFAGDRPGTERSLLYQHLNAGKRSITLDLETAGGQRIARELCREASLVIESFAPGTMDRLGLGYGTLRESNPALVCCSISNFGQDGPWRDRVATGMTEYALGGSMYIIGDPDREPLNGPGRQAEYVTGLFALLASVAAVRFAAETGRGQRVDASILEAVASIQENTTSTYVYANDIWKRQGNRRLPYPMTVLPCRDGYVGVNAISDPQWEMLLTLMERPDLADDPRFANGAIRLEHADALDAEISEWLRGWDADDVYHQAQLLRIPFGQVSTPVSLLSSQQLLARSYFATVEHPEIGAVTLPGLPAQLPPAAAEIRRAPLLGEHTTDVLQELGYTREQRYHLAQMGVTL